MAYVAWSVVFGEQPSAAKWNILGTNDAGFNNGTGFASGAIGTDNASLATGIVRQVVSANFTAGATGTTLIPEDDTIPQITEGTEFMTLAITPKSATNRLYIRATGMLSQSTSANDGIAALFQDATTNAIAGKIMSFGGTAGNMITMTVEHDMVAGTTSSTTFRYRAGLVLAGTMTFNGFGGSRKLGGISLSNITITEYKG